MSRPTVMKMFARLTGFSAGVLIGVLAMSGVDWLFQVSPVAPDILPDPQVVVCAVPAIPEFTQYGVGCGGRTAEGFESSVVAYQTADGRRVSVRSLDCSTVTTARAYMRQHKRLARTWQTLDVATSPWTDTHDERVLLTTRPDEFGRSGEILVRKGSQVVVVTATTPAEALALELYYLAEGKDAELAVAPEPARLMSLASSRVVAPAQ